MLSPTELPEDSKPTFEDSKWTIYGTAPNTGKSQIEEVGYLSICHGPSKTCVGDLVYDYRVDEIKILSIGVHEDFRRQNAGTLLIKTLQSAVADSNGFLERIVAEVPQESLDVQCFLRSLEFIATPPSGDGPIVFTWNPKTLGINFYTQEQQV